MNIQRILYRLTHHWTFMRWIRLVISVLIIVEGIKMAIWPFVGIGSLFCLTTLLGIGGCIGGNCSLPTNEKSDSTHLTED